MTSLTTYQCQEQVYALKSILEQKSSVSTNVPLHPDEIKDDFYQAIHRYSRV